MNCNRLVPFILAAGLMPALGQAADSPWTVRVGVHDISPDSASDTAVGEVEADSAVGVTLNLDYAITPHLTVDLLAALPFEHDILLDGNKIGSTQHLPPTLSLQYRFSGNENYTPYLALGVNYTTFFEDSLDGTSTDLKLEDSWGLAGQAGVDILLSDRWLVGVDLRYIQIETDVSVGGTDIGSVALDPWVYGVNLGYNF